MDDFDAYITYKYKAYNSPQQETPIILEPSYAQLRQIIAVLQHCYSDEAKSQFLRVWIRDWTENKLNEKNTQNEYLPVKTYTGGKPNYVTKECRCQHIELCNLHDRCMK